MTSKGNPGLIHQSGLELLQSGLTLGSSHADRADGLCSDIQDSFSCTISCHTINENLALCLSVTRRICKVTTKANCSVYNKTINVGGIVNTYIKLMRYKCTINTCKFYNGVDK